jgi:phage/plasmid-associated DNA primase
MSTQLLLVFLILAVFAKTSLSRLIREEVGIRENGKSVIAKLIEILQGREEMTNVIRYLELAENDLQNKLPSFDSGIIKVY